ncbi:hypothetical protein D3C80_1983260 [compost metagenome]
MPGRLQKIIQQEGQTVFISRRITGIYLNQTLQKGNGEFPASHVYHLAHPFWQHTYDSYVEMYANPQRFAA